jgi:hypothetical protein
MTTPRQHHGHGINNVVNLRRATLCQQLVQIAADGLKGLLQEIQARDESLIGRQVGKVMSPILVNEPMNRFLLEQALPVTEEVNGNQFLVSEIRLCVIAQALKTSRCAGIVNVTGKQIEFNELIFHGKKILLMGLFACHLNS